MKSTKGFTLIELLVVISIIGLLSSVVLASLNTARDKAKKSRIQSEVISIRTALELGRNDNGVYPNIYKGVCFFGTYVGSLGPVSGKAYDIMNDIIAINGGFISAGGTPPASGTGFFMSIDVCGGGIGLAPFLTRYAIYGTYAGTEAAGENGYFCADSSGKTTSSNAPMTFAGNALMVNPTNGGYCQ